MKTKLTLFVAVLAVALFGMGCVVPIETALENLFPENGKVNKPENELPGDDLPGDGPRGLPDGTIKYVLNGIADNKPEVLWEVLPASQQQTLNDELKKSMGNVDPEVHKQTFVVLQKLTGLLKNKKTLILEAANSFAEQGGAEAIPPEVTENWEGGVSLLEIVVNSKFSDKAWVQNPDLGALLKEDFGKIMASPVFDKLLDKMLKEENDFAPKTATGLRSVIKGIEVVVVSQTDTAATLKLRSETLNPNDPESEEFKMVKVEERWLPEVVTLGLEQLITQLKEVVPIGPLADTGMNAQQKALTLNFLKSVDGVLDVIDKQETVEDMMQAAVGGITGLATQLERLQNAFPNTGVAGGNPGVLPGLPASGPVPIGKKQKWTINGGKPGTRIDQIYLNKPAATIEAVFGVPDSKNGAYWIFNDMTVRNIQGGGTMTIVYFGIQNGIVVDIQARP